MAKYKTPQILRRRKEEKEEEVTKEKKWVEKIRFIVFREKLGLQQKDKCVGESVKRLEYIVYGRRWVPLRLISLSLSSDAALIFFFSPPDHDERGDDGVGEADGDDEEKVRVDPPSHKHRRVLLVMMAAFNVDVRVLWEKKSMERVEKIKV